MRVGKEANGDVRLSWGASCVDAGAVDTDYTVNEGTIGDFTSHVGVICSTGGVTEAVITPSAGNKYYLVVPRNQHFVGSFGLTSDAIERSPGPATCLPQDFAGCL